MKKMVLVVIFILMLFIMPKVDALANKGKLYEIGYKNAGVNVFASDTTYNSMDYNGWFIKSSVDDFVYYCIEPEVYMQNESEAVSSTHNVYKGDDIVKYSRLSKKDKDYISLLAYYGYKYPSHEDKKWYGITQVLIWQYIRDDITWKFKKERYGTSGNYFSNEVNELKTLVSKHNLLPSFSNEVLNLEYQDNFSIKDTNNVLKNYQLSSNDLGAKIEEDKLVIESLKPGEYTLEFKQRRIDNEIALFHSTSLQDLISRGDISYNDFKIKINILGKVIIHKKDFDTKTFNEELVGSILIIMDQESKEEVKKVEITGENMEVSLPIGNYILKEESSSTDYLVNDDVINFSITNEKNIIELDYFNKKDSVTFEIKKYLKDYDLNIKSESNAVFLIKDLNNKELLTLKTNENGVASTTLKKGDYYLEQISGDENYSLIDKIKFSINNDLSKTLYNLEKSNLLFIKKDADTNELLQGCVIGLYDTNNNLIVKGETNDKGEVLFKHLDLNTYYLKEISPPNYYIKNEDVIEVVVDEYLKTISYVMTNKKEEGKFTFQKLDYDTKKALEGGIFQIYEKDSNKLVYEFTSKKEKLVITLPKNNYYIIEKSAPKDYEITSDKYYFSLYEDNINIEFLNKKIINPDTFDNINIYYFALVTSIILLIIIVFIKRRLRINFIS